jgi:hypothetical protein
MNILDFQLGVQGHPTLADSTRDSIVNESGFSRVPMSRLGQLWGGAIPNTLRMNLDVHGTAVCVADDWATTIFGGKLEDCVRGLSAIVSTLGETLGVPVQIELLHPGGATSNRTLSAQLDRELLHGKIWAGVRYSLTLVIGAALGAGMSALVQ